MTRKDVVRYQDIKTRYEAGSPLFYSHKYGSIYHSGGLFFEKHGNRDYENIVLWQQ